MSEFIGFLDSYENGLVTGWVASTSPSAEHVKLDFMINGQKVGDVFADKFRADLLDAGVGAGDHAFTFAVPKHYLKTPHTLDVLAVDRPLNGSPVHHFPTKPTATIEPLCKGQIDQIYQRCVHGWCIIPSTPNTKATLELWVDGRLIQTFLADRYRQDLKDANLSNGYSGFICPLPEHVFDGLPHMFEVKARIKEKKVSIGNSPMCAEVNKTDSIIGACAINIDGLIHGWYLDSLEIEQRISLDIYINDIKLNTVTANKYRKDLHDYGDQSGNYSFQTLIPNAFFKQKTLEIDIRLSNSSFVLYSETLHCSDYYPYQFLNENLKQKAQVLSADLAIRPLISILMPTYRSDIKYLDMAIESVRQQSYDNWELCIADDASESPELESYLRKLMASDHRIKVVFRQENGHISAASNSALSLCTGEYTALLDHDDLLHPNALLQVVIAVQNTPKAAIIFSNEDKCDLEGNRFGPYFKKGFDHDLLMEQNLISHLGVYKTELLNEIGGFRMGYEGSQDYDLALRVLQRIEESQVVHIPEVLYHWRAIPGSTAVDISEKGYAILAFKKSKYKYINYCSRK